MIFPWFFLALLCNGSNLFGREGSLRFMGFCLLFSPLMCWYSLFVCLCVDGEIEDVLRVGTVRVSIPFVEWLSWDFRWECGYSLSQLLCVCLLCTVSFCIHMYSLWYMSDDRDMFRFLSILSIFTGSMGLLMLSEDILLLFLGWELIGISSFLLISYYENRVEAIRAGFKALLYNRLGDVCFLFGIVCGLSVFYDSHCGVWSFLSHQLSQSEGVHKWVGFCILCAGWAKSAQLGLHPWLLDAMEGATPVSALLHSATLVTAGVLLFWKLDSVLFLNSSVSLLCYTLGSVTALCASLTALLYMDLKRVVAYSTCSHIALMVMGLGNVGITRTNGSMSDFGYGSVMHLFTHGWSKSLLFMLCGLVLHICHQQDMRNLGGLHFTSPFLFSINCLCLLSIQGLPGSFISTSKDFLLECALFSFTGSTFLAFLLAIFYWGQAYSLSIAFHTWVDSMHSPNFKVDAHLILPNVFLISCVIFLPALLLDLMIPNALEASEVYETGDVLGFLDLLNLLLPLLPWVGVFQHTSSKFVAFNHHRLNFDKFFASVSLFFSNVIVTKIQSHLEYGIFMHFLFLN